jgi:hypothetical protein
MSTKRPKSDQIEMEMISDCDTNSRTPFKNKGLNIFKLIGVKNDIMPRYNVGLATEMPAKMGNQKGRWMALQGSS